MVLKTLFCFENKKHTFSLKIIKKKSKTQNTFQMWTPQKKKKKTSNLYITSKHFSYQNKKSLLKTIIKHAKFALLDF